MTWLEDLQHACFGHPDKVPKEFVTASAAAKAWKMTRFAAARKLGKHIRNGDVEMRFYKVKTKRGLQKIPHYGPAKGKRV